MRAMYVVHCRAVPQGVWLPVGQFEATGYSHAIRRARSIKKEYAAWGYWQATLIANRTGKNLGRTRMIEFEPENDLFAF